MRTRFTPRGVPAAPPPQAVRRRGPNRRLRQSRSGAARPASPARLQEAGSGRWAGWRTALGAWGRGRWAGRGGAGKGRGQAGPVGGRGPEVTSIPGRRRSGEEAPVRSRAVVGPSRELREPRGARRSGAPAERPRLGRGLRPVCPRPQRRPSERLWN